MKKRSLFIVSSIKKLWPIWEDVLGTTIKRLLDIVLLFLPFMPETYPGKAEGKAFFAPFSLSPAKLNFLLNLRMASIFLH